MNKYIEQGNEEDELSASLSNITGSFPLNIVSNGKLL